MKARSTSRPDAVEERCNAASSRPALHLNPGRAAAMPDMRAASLAQLRHQERADKSAQVTQLLARACFMAPWQPQPEPTLTAVVPTNSLARLNHANDMGSGILHAGGAVEQKMISSQAILPTTKQLVAASTIKQPQAAHSAGVVQRATWDGWAAQFGVIAPRTERIAKLGIAIVEFLAPKTGTRLRIGGSLSAAMFGGRRKPVDIDIDVVGGLKPAGVENEGETQADIVKSRFMKMQNISLTVGTDLFYIASLSKTSSGVNVQYLHTVTKMALDPSGGDHDEEIEESLMPVRGDLFSVDVDFTAEEMFSLSGLKVDEPEGEQGYYGSTFLLAAYLKRLASTDSDPKNDHAQIRDLLVHSVRTRLGQLMPETIEKYLHVLLSEVRANHVTEKNDRLGKMEQLFVGIIPEVINEFYFL